MNVEILLNCRLAFMRHIGKYGNDEIRTFN